MCDAYQMLLPQSSCTSSKIYVNERDVAMWFCGYEQSDVRWVHVQTLYQSPFFFDFVVGNKSMHFFFDG